jgi:hypothetical protein
MAAPAQPAAAAGGRRPVRRLIGAVLMLAAVLGLPAPSSLAANDACPAVKEMADSAVQVPNPWWSTTSPARMAPADPAARSSR